jgi:hypothetical protein
MAGTSSRRGKKKGRAKTATHRKRKPSRRKPQSPLPPGASYTELPEATRRSRDTAARVAMMPASPDFPGTISPEQFGGAPRAEAGSVAAAADDATFTGAVKWPPEVRDSLTELKQAIAEVESSPTPGVGHNLPRPLEQTALEEIKREIETLESQPATPSRARAAASVFRRCGKAIFTWVKTHLDEEFLSEFMKSAGKESGKAVVQVIKWSTLANLLYGLAGELLQFLAPG